MHFAISAINTFNRQSAQVPASLIIFLDHISDIYSLCLHMGYLRIAEKHISEPRLTYCNRQGD